MDYKLHGPGRNPSPATYKLHLLGHVSSLICKILIFGASMWLVYIIWLLCYSSKTHERASDYISDTNNIYVTNRLFYVWSLGWDRLEFES